MTLFTSGLLQGLGFGVGLTALLAAWSFIATALSKKEKNEVREFNQDILSSRKLQLMALENIDRGVARIANKLQRDELRQS